MLDDKTPLTQGQMCDDAAKDEGGQERQGDDEAVEETVVAFADAVPHPGTVVVESLCGHRQHQYMRSIDKVTSRSKQQLYNWKQSVVGNKQTFISLEIKLLQWMGDKGTRAFVVRLLMPHSHAFNGS